MDESPPDLFITEILKFTVARDPAGKPLPWLEDRATIGAVVEAAMALPLFAGLTFGELDEAEPLQGVEHAKSLVAIGKEVVTSFSDVGEGTGDLLLYFAAMESSLEVKVWAAGEHSARHRDTILDQCVELATKVRAVLAGVAGLEAGHVVPTYRDRWFNYLRSRPPRQHFDYPGPAVIDFLDRTFHGSGHLRARPDDLAALLDPPPPSPARVVEDDGLVIVRWAESAADADLRAGAAAHEQWIADRLTTELARGFNEQGDQVEARGTTKPEPPLTLYSARTHVGYKAVLVLPDGSVEDTAWDAAKQIVDAKALDDGKPVTAVKLVVPLREHVFEIAGRAKAAGFAAVLYPDDKGNFWNPDPPGQWRTPPAGSPPK